MDEKQPLTGRLHCTPLLHKHVFNSYCKFSVVTLAWLPCLIVYLILALTTTHAYTHARTYTHTHRGSSPVHIPSSPSSCTHHCDYPTNRRYTSMKSRLLRGVGSAATGTLLINNYNMVALRSYVSLIPRLFRFLYYRSKCKHEKLFTPTPRPLKQKSRKV